MGENELIGTVAAGGPFEVIAGGSYNVPVSDPRSSPCSMRRSAKGRSPVGSCSPATGRRDTSVVTGATLNMPVAGFTAAPTGGFAPLDVSFTDALTGTITGLLWEFGDGASSMLANRRTPTRRPACIR